MSLSQSESTVLHESKIYVNTKYRKKNVKQEGRRRRSIAISHLGDSDDHTVFRKTWQKAKLPNIFLRESLTF